MIATLVFAGYHRLRYLLTAELTTDETVSIPTIGGATPDTLTDSLGSGTIKKLSKAVADGYGQFAAGTQLSTEARALWASNHSVDPGPGIPTARVTITPRSGSSAWAVVSSASGGNPIITAGTIAAGEISTAYLDVEVFGTIGA